MINFIIYENDKKLRNYYELVILNFIGTREEKFKIFDYKKCKKQSYNRSIYILSSYDVKDVIDIAKHIRNSDDWYSQIIIISNFKNLNTKLLSNKLLVLDYINYNSDIKERLKEDLYLAYRILTKEKTLNFILNGEIYKIPYQNILYIEKSNNQNYCTIHTPTNSYIINDTISNLEEQLDSVYFIKTHRSCIVNLYSIKQYNRIDNSISFYKSSKTIDLITRDKRKILKERIIDNQISE